MTIKIAVASQKGGVWKTTTSVSVAHGLAKAGGSVLLADLDPQGHDAISFGKNPAPGIFNYFVNGDEPKTVITDTGRERLHLLPGNSRTKTAETVLRSESSLPELVSKLDAIVAPYSHAVLDTPANGLLQEMAIAALGPNDVLIIPAQLEALGLDGVAGVMHTVKRLGKPGRIVILPTGYDSRVKEHETNFNTLRNAYPDLVTYPVYRRAAVAEAAAYGRTIWEADQRRAKDVVTVYTVVINLIVDFGLETIQCQK